MPQPEPDPTIKPSTTGETNASSTPTPMRTVPLVSINVPNVRGQSLTNEEAALVASHVASALASTWSADPNCTLVNSEIVTCQHPDSTEGFCQINYYECEDGSSYEETIPL